MVVFVVVLTIMIVVLVTVVLVAIVVAVAVLVREGRLGRRSQTAVSAENACAHDVGAAVRFKHTGPSSIVGRTAFDRRFLGLGLAIAASVAGHHNGALVIDPVEKGASLTMSVELAN